MNYNNKDVQKYLIVLTELTDQVHLKELINVLHKKVGLNKRGIKRLMTKVPRIITTVSSLSEARLLRSELESFGCRIEIEPLVPDLPIDIPEKYFISLKKELSRVLRSKISLALFYIQVNTENPDVTIPSIMSVQTELEKCFRESDTVFSLNDNSFILLGFSTDVDGAEYLGNKIIQALYKIFNEKIRITMGYSVFPDQARTIADLLSCTRETHDKVGSGTYVSTQDDFIIKPEKSDSRTNIKQNDNTIQLYFNKARGRLLRRFYSLDVHELWFGLSKLPKANQEAFLYRLPHDFQMGPTLEKIILSQPKAVGMEPSIESRLQEIIYSMDLENSLAERYKIQEDILSKLNTTDALPVLPHVAKRIIEIISNPDSSVEDLTGVIETDSTLTIKILKVVNSAFYGYSQKIHSVKEAIVILGNEEILNMALALAVAKTLSSSHLEGCCNPESLWHHSIGTAVIAQHICNKLPQTKGMSVFTAGLLHDFGKIFLMEHFPELYRRIHLDALKYELPLYEVEEEKCNINHAKIGEIIAAKWNLPRILVLSIAKHHQFLKKDIYSELSAIISLADYLYHKADTREHTTDVASSLSNQLTYGHFSILKGMIKGFNVEKMEEMIAETTSVLEENQEILTLA